MLRLVRVDENGFELMEKEIELPEAVYLKIVETYDTIDGATGGIVS